MHASAANHKPRERSARSLFGALWIADGLLCPTCERAIKIYDVQMLNQSTFQIICGGCHRTLFACEESQK
jgi:hypothetical protein